ncbi:MAG: hypothetical protein ACUVSX_15235 [Aggregatilineales bacterium]
MAEMLLVVLICLEIVAVSALAAILCGRRVALVERDSGRVAVGPLPLRGACFLVARGPALAAAGLEKIAVLPSISGGTVRVYFTDGAATTLRAMPRTMISSELDLALLQD